MRAAYLLALLTALTPVLTSADEKPVRESPSRQASSPARSAPHEPDACAPIDLSEKLGPNRDQGPIGWCFAYAGADLLNAELGRSTRDPRSVSAANLALNYYLEQGQPNKPGVTAPDAFRRERGHTSTTLRAALDNGVCAEAKLPADSGDFPIAIQAVRRGLQSLLDTAAASANASACGLLSQRPRPRTKKDSGGASPATDPDAIAQELARAFGGIPLENLRDAVSVLEADFVASLGDGRLNPRDLASYDRGAQTAITRELTRLQALSCSPMEPIPAMSIEEARSYPENQRLVQRALDERRPLGISLPMSSIAPSSEGSHALLIVGRLKSADGKCYYRFRNSWGSRCSLHRRITERRIALPTDPGKPPAEIPGCSRGDFYLSESELTDILREPGSSTLVLRRD